MHRGPSRRLERSAQAGARLPYLAHCDDRTLETRDGLLLCIIAIEGLAFETMDTVELNYRKALRDSMIRSIANSRFAIYHHILRREIRPSLPGQFPDPFTDALDRAWQLRLEAKRLYVNDQFLTLVLRPPQGRGGALRHAVSRFGLRANSPDAGEVAARARMADLRAASDALISGLSAYRPRALKLYDSAAGICSEPLEMLSALYNGIAGPVLAPDGDLGHHIPFRRVSFGRDTLELSAVGAGPSKLCAILSVKDYPARTAPGMLDDLLRLPYELAVTQSFAFVDRQVSLSRMNLAMRRMRSTDDEAISLHDELASAKDEAAAGRAAFGEHHLTIQVSCESLPELAIAVGDVRGGFAEIGAIAVREDVNLESAFWAQFPGNFRDIGRRALVSTRNFAGLASGHGFSLGDEQGNHWGPAVAILETTAAGPYFFNFHNGDLGNFTVVGPSGSGKTVVLNFLIAQAQRFAPRTILFDKDRGAEIFIRAVGGRYASLRPGEASGFNPLLLPDTPGSRRFLSAFLAKLLSVGGEPLTVVETATLADAIDASFDQAAELRRLRYFGELLRGGVRPGALDLAARLLPWCEAGEHAWLFDNEVDTLDLNEPTLGFDMTRILDDPVCRTPAMMYLFHRIEERLDGSPTLIVIDEGWKALDDEIFVQRLRDWEKTVRKRNAIVGFCTQSAEDALQSKISAAIIEQSATHIFMANPKAQEADYCGGFGLTTHELELVRSLPDTAHCFLIRHGGDSVVARLDLTGEDDLLKVLSGREHTVRVLDELRRDLGDAPERWLAELLVRS